MNDKNDTIKTLEQEKDKLSESIVKLKNNIEQIKQESRNRNVYTITGYNNSFDNSIVVEKDTPTHTTKKVGNLQEDLGIINHSNNSINSFGEKDSSQILNNTSIQHQNQFIDDSLQQYLTPEVIILNNEQLFQDSTNVFHGIGIENAATPKDKPKNENVQKQIEDLKEKTQLNSLQISEILELLNQTKQTIILPPKLPENDNSKQNPTKKKNNCYLIGDYNIQNIDQALKADTIISNQYQIKSNIQEHMSFMQIKEGQLPKNIDENDIVIISSGTNDLYATKTEDIADTINTIGQQPCRTIVISIPPQDCLFINKNVIKLNTFIKHQCVKHNNINIMNS